jgi:ribulose-phosphate 3-epimerase
MLVSIHFWSTGRATTFCRAPFDASRPWESGSVRPINPATSATVLDEVMQDVEQVLVMTVSPGFGHQQFLRSMLPKIRRARNMIDQMQLNCALEVDGGIDPTTAPLAVAAGADVLVAGSEIFDADEGIAVATQSLRAASTPGVMSCSWR